VAALDVTEFLASAGVSTIVDAYDAGDSIFVQGDPCEDVRYIQSGCVKLSVTSKSGREGVVGMFRPGDFFGEGCLAGQPFRMATATAVMPSAVIRMEKQTMIRLLHEQHGMSDRFIAHVLARNIRIQEDLIDQLINSAEKRLARTLLLLARDSEHSRGGGVPKVSQETLAEMVGTTRSRVNVFLNKFKKLGYIEYGDDHPLTVHRSLVDMLREEGLGDINA
jgi:CRP-like cAMP-binding protein